MIATDNVLYWYCLMFKDLKMLHKYYFSLKSNFPSSTPPVMVLIFYKCIRLKLPIPRKNGMDRLWANLRPALHPFYRQVLKDFCSSLLYSQLVPQVWRSTDSA